VAERAEVLGIPEIDKPLGTALPAGWIAILTGETGAGAPVLAKQFAQAASGAVPVLFYTTYERTEDVRQTFSDFGWDADGVKIVNLAEEYYERVLLHGIEVARVRERGLSIEEVAGGVRQTAPPPKFRLTDRMLADLAAIDAPFRLVLDSVDFFFEVLDPREITVVVRQIRHRCQMVGGQALLTLHSAAHDAATTALLQDLADLVLVLRAEPKADRYAHTLLIEKVGHRPDLTRIWAAQLGNGGWTVGEPPKSRG
jgi:KaiC/GvpD/RAD55 family RecA-like ATPase